MRPLTRSFNKPRTTRSTKSGPKSEPKTVPLEYEEIKVPGGAVDWRFRNKIVRKYRFPTVVRISRTKTKGEYYKSVHAAKTIPANKMVGVYMGALIDKSCVRDGRCQVVCCGPRSSRLKMPGQQDYQRLAVGEILE